MGAKRAIYFGPPDRPNRGFFYGPSYESIWTNDFHYKACCSHEKNYFQFDGEGDAVGRPQTLLMRSWREELEKQARDHHIAARIETRPTSRVGASQSASAMPSSPDPPPPYLANCSPELCPPSFRPAGAKRFTLSPDKPPPTRKEFARELWDPSHTRIIYMKTAKPQVAKHVPASLPLLPHVASPSVSPQKAQQQLKEQQLKQQQLKEQQLKEQQQLQRQHVHMHSASDGGSVLLTRHGESRKDYVSEVSDGGRIGFQDEHTFSD